MPNDLIKVFPFELDTVIERTIKPFFYFQGDTRTAVLEITVTENGEPLNLTGTDVRATFKKQDGTSVMQDKETGLTIKEPENGIVRIVLSSQVLAVAGRVRGQLSISSQSGVLVAETVEFSFITRESLANGGVLSNDDLPIVEKVVEASKILDELDLELLQENITVINAIDERLTDEINKNNDKFKSVNQQLAQNEENLRKSDLFNKLYGRTSLYGKPSGFTMNIPFSVYTSVSGKVEHDYDLSINKNKVTKRYVVDVKNGSNTNPGTESEPFKSIHRALRYGDADEIIVKEGIYGWTNGFGGFTQSKSFNLIGQGNVYLGAHRDGLTWTPHATLTNVYQTNATSVYEVIDMRDFENPEFLTQQPDVQSVSDNPNSYHIDSGNNIYVRTIDDRVPDDYILCNLGNKAASTLNVDNVYMENIKFTNTVQIEATSTNPNAKFYAKHCDFFYGSNDNSLSILGVDFTIQKCRAKFATRDGFNYHIRNGILSNGIEIDCEGAYNGRDGANQNNGSTMHDGGSILRINGEYHHNHGPNVIDVNPGTKSLNIGVHAHHSTATADISNTDFKCGNDGGTEMWLVNCISHDSKYSVVTHGAGSVTHEDNSLILSEKIAI